jgi:hypothetical protein
MKTCTQCVLERYGSAALRMMQTAWLPSEFAVVGAVLEIRDYFGKWEGGWRVLEAGSVALAESVSTYGTDYRRQGAASS